MSFRNDFIHKIHELYVDSAARRKSIDADWRKIKGFMIAFIEEISDVKEFACATTTESESELILAVEGHELAFHRDDTGIKVLIDGDVFADLYPTVEGYCTNYEDKKILDVMDMYMKAAFQGVMAELG